MDYKKFFITFVYQITLKQNNNMRNQQNINKIVNVVNENNKITEIHVLAHVFEYEDGFKGATGSRFDVISKLEYKERMKRKNIIAYLVDCGVERKQAKEIHKTSSINELENLMFDLSYSSLHDYMREELKLSEKEAFIFCCSGGGRMFGTCYQGNYNPDLSRLIREYEG